MSVGDAGARPERDAASGDDRLARHETQRAAAVGVPEGDAAKGAPKARVARHEDCAVADDGRAAGVRIVGAGEHDRAAARHCQLAAARSSARRILGRPVERRNSAPGDANRPRAQEQARDECSARGRRKCAAVDGNPARARAKIPGRRHAQRAAGDDSATRIGVLSRQRQRARAGLAERDAKGASGAGLVGNDVAHGLAHAGRRRKIDDAAAPEEDARSAAQPAGTGSKAAAAAAGGHRVAVDRQTARDVERPAPFDEDAAAQARPAAAAARARTVCAGAAGETTRVRERETRAAAAPPVAAGAAAAGATAAAAVAKGRGRGAAAATAAVAASAADPTAAYRTACATATGTNSARTTTASRGSTWLNRTAYGIAPAAPPVRIPAAPALLAPPDAPVPAPPPPPS